MKKTYLKDLSKHRANFYSENDLMEMEQNMSQEEVREFVKDCYKNNLPVDLLSWSRVNLPDDNMLYKDRYWRQVMFVRDTLPCLLAKGYDDFKNIKVNVINTHRSKSIDLPVYELTIPDIGMKLIMRNNFYDWKVSVISEEEVDIIPGDLFKDIEIQKKYCEGFKQEYVFGKYTDNKKQFTVEIEDDNKLVIFLYLICKYNKEQKKEGV